MRCRTICSGRQVHLSLLLILKPAADSLDPLSVLSLSQLRVASMAPSYSLKKSHLPAGGVALSQPAAAHLVKDLEVDNPRQELTLAQRYRMVVAAV